MVEVREKDHELKSWNIYQVPGRRSNNERTTTEGILIATQPFNAVLNTQVSIT